MLNSFHLGNFKAFGKTQSIPIRPITLIFGANSAGKSSIIHAMLLARHAMETGELDIHRTAIGGESVDLGGFRQYVYRRDTGLNVEWSAEISPESFSTRLKELLPEAKNILIGLTIGTSNPEENIFRKRTYDACIAAGVSEDKAKQISEKELIDWKTHLKTFWIEINKKPLLSMSYRQGDDSLQLDTLDYEHPAFQKIITSIIQSMTTTEKLEKKDWEGIEEAVNDLVPKVSFEIGNLFPSKLKKEMHQSETEEKHSLFPISKGSRKEDLKHVVETFLPRILQDIILGLTQNVESEMNRLSYLGPLRSYPPRHIAFSQHHDPNWMAGGGHAWDIVRKDTNIRFLVNKWLGDKEKLSTNYELKVRNLLAIEDIEGKHFEIASEIISDFEKKYVDGKVDDLFGELQDKITDLPGKLKDFEPVLSDIPELVLIDKRTDTLVSHRDVGIGISQVLPVLVTAYASRNNIISIEQPEIHLHPALQAELGDIFIESALGERKNTFILETHSEHLILRILRRIRETAEGEIQKNHTPINPDQVAVIFVSPEKDGSEIIHIPVNEDGEFAEPWPGGFFPDRAKELF